MKYTIDPIAILKDFINDEVLTETGKLSFTIDHGYITIYYRTREDYGSAETRYSYHPNTICEGKGICIHCGQTLFE